MLLKPTPGPWIVAMKAEIDGERMPDGSGGMSYTGRDVYDREYGVCTKEDWEQGEYEPESIARPWNEADAHLIAAAPDLLDALDALIAICDGFEAFGDTENYPECVAAMGAAKAARHKSQVSTT